MNLPNLVIIGGMKCGTVSLHKYLSDHPQIEMSPLKEVDYFVDDRNFSKGLHWYSSHFQKQSRIIGERSTSYTKYPHFSGVPEKIHEIIPQAKLIYSVRDPINRMISHYVHECARRRENRTIEDAFRESSSNNYIDFSRYYLQIEQYFRFFSADQIFVLSLEDLSKNTQEVLGRVFKFLDVDQEFDHPSYEIVHHRSRDLRRPTRFQLLLKGKPLYSRLYSLAPILFEQQINKPELDGATRACLVDIFRDDVRKLRSYTGEEYDTWCV